MRPHRFHWVTAATAMVAACGVVMTLAIGPAATTSMPGHLLLPIAEPSSALQWALSSFNLA